MRSRHTIPTLVLIAGTVFAPLARAQTEPPTRPSAPPRTVSPDELIPPELAVFEGRPIRRILTDLLKVPPAAPARAVTDKDAAPAGARAADKPVATVEPPMSALPLDAETDALIRNQLRLSVGQPYSRRLATEDLARLNRLGRFRRVELRVQPLDDGSVDVVYLVLLQPIIADVQSVGNQRIDDGELLAKTQALVGTPVDDTKLDRFCRQLEDLYREKGYYSAKVTVDREVLDRNSIVVFRVREGDKIRVTDIRFEGNTAFSASELSGDLKTKTWMGFFRRGTLDDDLLSEDVVKVGDFYRNRGYLDVKADRIVTPSPDGKEASVTFVVSEGPRYTLRSVKIEIVAGGEKVFTAEQIAGIMRIKQGDAYSLDALRKSVEGVRDAYSKLGYVDAAVERREMRDPAEPLVDINLLVNEGKRFRTGEVIVRGNDITRNDVVRRHVTFQPDRPLDGTAAEDTKRRLRETRLFGAEARVTLQPEDPQRAPAPDGLPYRDVLVEVQETNTGSFSLGGAVGSDSGLTARVAIEQRNFDVTDTPDSIGGIFDSAAFRGGGQRFQVEALPGTEQQQLSMSLSEPALNGSDYGGSARVFYTKYDYDDYTERRYGVNLGIERRFGERWYGSMPLRIESVGLSGIDPTSPTDYFKVEGDNPLTSLGLRLTRRTLDNAFRASRGIKTEFGIDQVGIFGGAFNFTKLRTEHQVYFPLTENFYGAKTVVSMKGRVEYIPQSFDDTPVYERYYLGGQNFRGFDYRGVSPRGVRADNGQPSDKAVGGNFLFFLGAEINQPLYEDTLAGVLFLDTGTVNPEFGFEDYRVSVGFGFRLYISQLSPIPLAFDFGFPIKDAEGDERRMFSFSIDVPFN